MPGTDTSLKIALLTGGKDPHYALGLVSGLPAEKISVDFIGNEDMQRDPAVHNKNIIYYNLRGDQAPGASFPAKALRVLRYYAALISYASRTDARIFHILWLNKFEYLDRTILNAYYKLLGKRLVLTAHNVNIGQRDGKNTFLNRWTLKVMYRLMDGIIVHTDKMKQQLVEEFGIPKDRIRVLPFGINNAVPRSGVSMPEARKRLLLSQDRQVLLFFGNIAPYKGLEHLIQAAALLKTKMPLLTIVIAGAIKKDCAAYWDSIREMIREHGLAERTIQKIAYIPDDEIETYYEAADVLVLPYNHIFQSGVIFLAYSFGLPVIATDVGCLRNEVVDGQTGFVCKPQDARDLAEKIELYFQSDLYRNLASTRKKIMDESEKEHSWISIGEKTSDFYNSLLPVSNNKA